MKRTTIVSSVAVAAVMLASVSVVHAVPSLRLSDGGTVINVSDEGAGDTLSGAGAVGFNGGIGSWTINVTSGITKPVHGTADSPALHLNSVNRTDSSGGNLEILFSETDYTLKTLSQLTFDVGGTTHGEVSFALWVDTGNSLFGTAGSPLITAGSFTGGAFSKKEIKQAVSKKDIFSVTLQALIHHDGEGITSFDGDVGTSVPENGMTLAFLGLGMVVISGVCRKAKRS